MRANVIKVMAVQVQLLAITQMFTACKKQENQDPYLEMSKNDLVTMARDYENQIADLHSSLDEKMQLLQGIQTQTGPEQAISEIPDGTGRLTFNEYPDGTIQLPTKLAFPDQQVTQTSNKVFITSTVSLKPNAGWNMVLDGDTIELENESLKIGAKIHVGYRDGGYFVTDYLQDYMSENFFKDWPPENITYRVIMNEDVKTGVNAYTHTFIDSEDAYAFVGMLNFGNTTLVYSCCYRGEESQVNNEAIEALIESIEIGGVPVQIEG